MTASADSRNPDLPLDKALPGKPATAPTAEPPKNAQATPQPAPKTGLAQAPAPSKIGNEEPAMLLEPDLPSDGRDEIGEAMIRELPQRPELTEPPSQPDPSTLKP
jgi:hypothetical protein